MFLNIIQDYAGNLFVIHSVLDPKGNEVITINLL